MPSPEGDVTYSYDLLSRPTGVSQSGYNLTFAYDALSRQTYDGQAWGNIARTFDLAGRLTRTTWWDGFYVDYDRDVTGQLLKVRENGGTSGVRILATFAYDNLGRRTGVTRGNGTTSSYSYDAISRLTSLTQNLASTANDLTIGSMAYNPAGQIVSQVRSNDAYAWTGHGNGSTASVGNGLNQLTSIGGSSASHDARGNVTTDPTSGKTYTYTAENALKGASGGVSIGYDPIGRLSEYNTTVSTRFMSDGAELAVEVSNPTGAVLRRYVRGDGPDELLVWYEGSGTFTRRFAHADERGSIVAYSNNSGVLVGINKYDEYGKPLSGNNGRMQYTGQAWLPEANVYHYKARAYAPTFGGRFLQTDPIGYAGGMNLYAYVRNDPVNLIDPLGLCDGQGFTSYTTYVDWRDFNGSNSLDDDGEVESSAQYPITICLSAYSASLTAAFEAAGTWSGGGGGSPSTVCDLHCQQGDPRFAAHSWGPFESFRHGVVEPLTRGVVSGSQALGDLFSRCITDQSNVSGWEVAQGAGSGAASGFGRGAVTGAVLGPGAAGGATTGAVRGTVTGALRSFISQACAQ